MNKPDSKPADHQPGHDRRSVKIDQSQSKDVPMPVSGDDAESMERIVSPEHDKAKDKERGTDTV